MTAIVLLILGGLISLVSSLATMFFTHRFEMKKIVMARKDHPTRVVYDKQIEFIEAMMPLLFNMNEYMKALETSAKSADSKTLTAEKGRNSIAAIQTQAQKHLDAYDLLVKKYYMYLPNALLKMAYQFSNDSRKLNAVTNPNANQLAECRQFLLRLRNFLRGFVGIDKLSQDFAEVFSVTAKSRPASRN